METVIFYINKFGVITSHLGHRCKISASADVDYLTCNLLLTISDSCGFAELHLACQLEVALSRNSQRRLPIPGPTVTSIAGSIEPPAPDKHHWEKHSTTLDNSAGVGADEAW